MKKRICSQWLPIMLTLFLGVVLAGARLSALGPIAESVRTAST
jgi:hypothetical protein